MATPAQRTNTWTLDEWYDQTVAGTTGGYNAPLNGELWTWGDNDHGQLGVNSRTYYSSPVQVPGTTWKFLGGHAKVFAAVKVADNSQFCVPIDVLGNNSNSTNLYAMFLFSICNPLNSNTRGSGLSNLSLSSIYSLPASMLRTL